MLDQMEVRYPAFGTLLVDGETYDHDVVIEDGVISPRDKTPSRPLKERYGHTPLSVEEAIPWSTPRLVIGTGHSGRLPVLPEVEAEADKRGVEVVLMPTSEAAALLNDIEGDVPNAILHVTC